MNLVNKFVINDFYQRDYWLQPKGVSNEVLVCMLLPECYVTWWGIKMNLLVVCDLRRERHKRKKNDWRNRETACRVIFSGPSILIIVDELTNLCNIQYFWNHILCKYLCNFHKILINSSAWSCFVCADM